MKIAITGHGKGLGKAIFDQYDSIKGFDRNCGPYDINNPSNILEESQDCDVFINNAYGEKGQLIMFKNLEDHWYQPGKLIVNISSVAVLKNNSKFLISMKDHKNFNSSKLNSNYASSSIAYEKYIRNKIELEEVSKNSRCKNTVIRMGVLKAYPEENYQIGDEERIDTFSIARLILEIIKSPFHVNFLEVSNGNKNAI